jgi:MFS family permease
MSSARTVAPDTAAALDPRSARRTVVAAMIGMVSLASGGLIIFPLYPALQERFGLSTTALGLVAASGFAASLLAELALAPQADRGHARRMAVAGLVTMAASLLLAGLATSTPLFIAAKALGGFGYGLFFPAVSAVLIRLDPDRAGASLGRLSAAELGGVAVGPFVSALLVAVLEPSVILIGSAALVLATALPLWLWFDEDRTVLDAHRGDAPTLAFDLLGHRRVWGAGLLTVALMVPVGAYDTIWPRFMSDLGAGEALIGASYVLFALPFMVVAPWAGRMGDRWGGGRAFALGLVVLAAVITSYALLSDPYVVTGLGMIESSGQALAFVGAATAMAQAVTSRRAGAAQGLARALGLIGATIAATFSGWAYQTLGASAMFVGTVVIVLVLAAVAGVLLRGRTTNTPIGD